MGHSVYACAFLENEIEFKRNISKRQKGQKLIMYNWTEESRALDIPSEI